MMDSPHIEVARFCDRLAIGFVARWPDGFTVRHTADEPLFFASQRLDEHRDWINGVRLALREAVRAEYRRELLPPSAFDDGGAIDQRVSSVDGACFDAFMRMWRHHFAPRRSSPQPISQTARAYRDALRDGQWSDTVSTDATRDYGAEAAREIDELLGTVAR